MKRVATVVMAVAALDAGVARAGRTCGSHSDGGSSVRDHRESSSSSNETSWSDTSTRRGVAVDTTSCIDDTDVVGYRRCTKFGTWARNLRLPRLFVELGTSVRQFDSMLPGKTGHVSHDGASFAFRTVMAPNEAAQDVAVTSSLRVGFGLPRGLYAGGELELGGLVAPAAANAEMMTGAGGPSIDQGRGLVVGGFAVAGIRGDMRRGSLAIEGAAGGRAVSYRFASAYYDCAESAAITASRGVVEARARGELFLNPWITAGATMGSNVLARGEWMGGVYLGFHSRAFAGRR